MSETPDNSPRRLRFGDLTVDLGRRLVLRGEARLDVAGLTFDFLRVLIEVAPDSISYDDLAERVWAGRPVTPETIAQRALMLRQALGDDVDTPVYLETVRGFGFRPVAPVTALNAGEPERRRAAIALALTGVVAGLGLLLLVQKAPPEVTVDPRASVAILPFENLSPNPDNAYIAAGLHNEVLSNLGRVAALRVVARQSVLRFADSAEPVEQIAEALDVGAIATGSVRVFDDQIRVQVEVSDGQTGEAMWSESYTRDFQDLLRIETDVAVSIARLVKASLLPSEVAYIEAPITRSPDAYAHYLRAIHIWNTDTFGKDDVRPAIERELNAAIAIDATFATAYAWRARLGAYAVSNMRESERVLDDADKALALDPMQGIAHAAVGEYHSRRYEGVQAQSAFERAIEVSANDPTVLKDYIRFLARSGQIARGVEVADRLLRLSPHSLDALTLAAYPWLMARRLERAEPQLRESLRLAPSHPGVRRRMAHLALAMGRNDEALRHLRIGEGLLKRAIGNGAYAYTYRMAGSQADAERLAGARSAASWDRSGVPYGLQIGDYDLALAEIAAAIDAGRRHYETWWLVRANAWNDPVLDTAPWRALRQRMGFPDIVWNDAMPPALADSVSR